MTTLPELERLQTTDEVRAPVGALLADGPHRDAVARLGARVRSSAGAVGAAEALEAAAMSHVLAK